MYKILTVILACGVLHVHGNGSSIPHNIPAADTAGVENIFAIIRSGDAIQLEQMLKEGADPNASQDGYSLLMAAALNGTTEELNILIRHGANVNYLNKDSLTALWLAIPDEEKTQLLLDKGADIHVNARGGMTFLNKLAAIPGAAPLIRLFINRGIDPVKNNDGNSLIIRAAISGDTANLSLFIRLGLDVNAEDQDGVAPIIHTAHYFCPATLKMLVEHGANINAVSKRRGMTALMNAARGGDEQSVIYLLEQGADAKLVDKMGYTALTYWGFSETDSPEITQTMVDQLGKAAFTRAKDGADALYWSQKRGETRAVQLLRKYMQQ